MAIERVTVFGGTGFLGRRIAQRLRLRGLQVRAASRHVEAALPIGIEPVYADLTAPDTLTAALSGADAAVNAVALYVEKGNATFTAVHVEGAGALATACREQGVARLLNISGLGADPASRSPYVRARGRGETAVRDAFGAAVILRPSVLFAADDAFLTTLLRLVRQSPVIPLFGDGATLLQPVFADDVAEAVACLLTETAVPAPLYAFGGPEVYSYRRLLELAMEAAGTRRPLVPVPFALWRTIAFASQALPSPPLTEGQVALMQQDNIAPPDLPSLEDLGIAPVSLTEVLGQLRGKS